MATASMIEMFKSSLKKFFPTGKAWQLRNSNIELLIDSLAGEFCRVQERFNQLLEETDPRQADELLVDWEESLALPDECSTLGATVEERRNQLIQKLTNQGGSSFQYFEDIASNLGFDVTVTDYSRFQAGKSVAGDSLTNEQWDFWFQATAPADLSTVFKAGVGKAGDKLVELGNETLECTFEKLKPAHTEVLFVFV